MAEFKETGGTFQYPRSNESHRPLTPEIGTTPPRRTAMDSDPRSRIDALTEDMARAWRVAVEVPATVPAEDVDRLTDSIAEVVDEWQPNDRDWDPFIHRHNYSHSSEAWLAAALRAVLRECDIHIGFVEGVEGETADAVRGLGGAIRDTITTALEGKK